MLRHRVKLDAVEQAATVVALAARGCSRLLRVGRAGAEHAVLQAGGGGLHALTLRIPGEVRPACRGGAACRLARPRLGGKAPAEAAYERQSIETADEWTEPAAEHWCGACALVRRRQRRASRAVLALQVSDRV